VRNRTVAEEVVQETWLGVLNGIARFDAHLALCEGCVHYVTQMRQTVEAAHQLHPSDVEACAPDALLEAFRAWQRGEPIPEA
jgi:hypothetical protein